MTVDPVRKRPASRGRRTGATRSPWPWPIVMAVLTGVGLVCALLGDGVWDVASWIGLGIPVIVCAWFGFRRRPAER